MIERPPHRVLLLSVENEYRARPAYTAAVPGDAVRFANYSGTRITLSFPAGLFERTEVEVADGSAVELVAQKVANGRYPYKGRLNGEFVLRGESSPEIIIDR